MPIEETTKARPVLAILQEQRKGLLVDEMSDALQNLVAAIVEADKAGTLTLTLRIKPENGVLFVTDEIKTVAPKTIKTASIFFASPNNNLIREDPKQIAMQLEKLPESDKTIHKLHSVPTTA